MRKKVLVLTTQIDRLQKSSGLYSPQSNWGIPELSKDFDVTILPVQSILSNTYVFVKSDFEILFLHNCDPVRFLPLHILKVLFPSAKKKKVICLCHASVFGKSRKTDNYKWMGGAISWMLKGYSMFLFFSQRSLAESISAGIPRSKCRIVHWGADMGLIEKKNQQVSDSGYWLSSGKENRNYSLLDRVAVDVSSFSNLLALRGGKSYDEITQLTASCRGCVVVPNNNGLNYCTGLTCIVDAFAFGKPIIAVRNPYYPFDIEEKGCGIYVNPNSPQEIVNAIRKIEKDPLLYQSMCRNSKIMSESYNMERYVTELCNVIDEL